MFVEQEKLSDEKLVSNLLKSFERFKLSYKEAKKAGLRININTKDLQLYLDGLSEMVDDVEDIISVTRKYTR